MARFIINYTIHGRTTRIIEAESLEEAEARVSEDLETDEVLFELDEVDDVDYHISEMHLVIREGRKIWTTYIRETDTPA